MRSLSGTDPSNQGATLSLSAEWVIPTGGEYFFVPSIPALRSRFAIIRQCAARCFATICDVITVAAMRFVIEKMVPYLGDAPNITNRQGATELIYRECLRSPFACQS